MLVTFDIDCGELAPGHHFVARGLSGCETPHPDDLAVDLEPLPEHPGTSGIYSVMLTANATFADDDDSFEAQVWRRRQRSKETLDKARKVRGFNFEYELVPGVTEAELDERGLFAFLPAINYQADQPLTWEVTDSGAIAPARGGLTTHGSRGTWPIPAGARRLTFVITGIDAATGFEKDDPDGTLTVDLATSTASWTTAK